MYISNSHEHRHMAKERIERALILFEHEDKSLIKELADLPNDLDVYLRLVRDRKRLERKQQQLLEASSGVSHALNYHLGSDGGAGLPGPSFIDELFAEEQELRKQEEEEKRENVDEGEEELDSRGSRRRGRRKKKGPGSALGKDPMDRAAYARYNARDGLFSMMEAGRLREQDLEAQYMSAEGTAKVEAFEELSRVRASNSESIANFMHDYQPQRLPTQRDVTLESVDLLSHLPTPSELVAQAEEEVHEASRLEMEERRMQEAEAVSSASGLALEAEVGPGGAVESGQEYSEDEDYVRLGSRRQRSRGAADGGGQEYSEDEDHVPLSRGGGRRSLASGRTGGWSPKRAAPGGGRQQIVVPGDGVAEEYSRRVILDELHARGIIDLPNDVPLSMNEEGHVEEPGFRDTVTRNTSALDLSFPTLEFNRRKEHDEADYLMPGHKPPSSFQRDPREGAYWSMAAREKHSRRTRGGEGVPSEPGLPGGEGVRRRRVVRRKRKKKKATAVAASRAAPAETVQGAGDGGDQEEDYGDEFDPTGEEE